jgi:PleD family two-component response regulator
MEASVSMRAGTGLKKVLLVDDCQTSLLVHELLLSDYPYEITKVQSGAEALARATEDPPDLVVLDIMMPDPGGLEVLRALRAGERTRDVPVLLVSACGDRDIMDEAARSGGTDYLTKPVDGTKLRSKVSEQLGA